ncbi:CpsD/CapB family tyrosine-protein kinase [Alkalilacustris brevis]|uniref:CpsD/CapB family tyrosine-protein kinase n=1 Tax=Alkalilacustris brevis TaxID=2026338 RepID=UPI0012D2DE91|nr:CpsD/CapB family tyrosine-protein kinase [Alkalilacustris brevis]
MAMVATNTEALETALNRRPQTLEYTRNQGHTSAWDDLAPDLNAVDPQAAAWEALRSAMVLPPNLRQQRLMAARRDPGASRAFDMLRMRMLQTLRAHGWHRVAIAAPTAGSGTSFITASLGLSLSRVEGCRTVALDLDLRAPSLGASLGMRPAGSMADWLSGEVPMAEYLQRSGCNLALGLNLRSEPDRSTCLLRPEAGRTLAAMQKTLAPDVVLCDLPPLLGNGDALAFLSHVDCILLVADAQSSTAAQISECKALFEGEVPFLGVVLNQAETGERADHDEQAAG